MGDERGRQHRNQAAGQRWQTARHISDFAGATRHCVRRGEHLDGQSGKRHGDKASDGMLLGTFNTPLEPYGIAFDGTDIWVTGLYVYGLRASDGAILGRLVPGTNTIGAAFDGANIWIAGLNDNSVGKL